MIYLIILLAIISRFIPHIPNFAPITAIAIFSAAHLNWKKAAGITFAARFVSDVFLCFFFWPLMVAVYLSHLAGVGLGLWIKKSKMDSRLRGNDKIKQWTKIIGSSLIASAIFFLVTNFALLYSNYPHNFSGIVQAYINGLPFLRGTLIGDMFYSVALFGMYELAQYYANKRYRASKFQTS